EVSVNPLVLARRAESHQQHGAAGARDLLNYPRLLGGGEVAVTIATDDRGGMMLANPPGDFFGDSGAGPQEENSRAGSGERFAKTGKHVGAVDVLADLAGQQFSSELHADAVSQHKVARFEHCAVLRVAPCDVAAIGVHETELSGRLAACAVDNPGERVGHGDVVDGDADDGDEIFGNGDALAV